MKYHSACMAALAAVALFLFAHASGAQEGDPKTRTMYVKVASSNPEAVIQSSTDFFEAEALGTLIQNQPVAMFEGIKDGEYVKIIARIDGKVIEGWVKASILQDRPLENIPRISDGGDVDDADFEWGGSFRHDPDRDMRKDSPQMKAALERMDAFEKLIAEHRGIKRLDHDNADSGRYLTRVRAFAIDGGLQPGSSR